MINESVLRNIAEEETAKRQALEARLDAERTDGLIEIMYWRGQAVEALTKEDWAKEYEFWTYKLIQRKWELESSEGWAVKGPTGRLKKDIEDFLEKTDTTPRQNMTKEEWKSLVKKVVTFADLALDEEVGVASFFGLI